MNIDNERSSSWNLFTSGKIGEFFKMDNMHKVVRCLMKMI